MRTESKSTGPGACLPNGKVNFGDRIIGAWDPDGSTTRVQRTRI
jgi:hypothetical protein